MNQIAILDCTLRDGGYINHFHFGRGVIKSIINGLSIAGMDIIECGFLMKGERDPECSLFGNIKALKKLIAPKAQTSMYVAMVAYGDFPLEELCVRCSTTIDGIRLTFHKEEMEGAFEYAREVMKLGYEVFIQPVGTTAYTDIELLKMIEEVNSIKPFAFYMVDTLGILYVSDLQKMFYLIDKNLNAEIRIGYHSHNNLQMAFANAQFLAQNCGKRNIIIDSSILGMGRGSGNLNTELIVHFINDKISNVYNLDEILMLLDEYILPLSKQYTWGYSSPYFIASMQHCHPNYVTFLTDKQTMTIKQIERILNEIPYEHRDLYDQTFIEEFYTEHQKSEYDDTENVASLKSMIGDRPLLILAPGSSVKSKKAKIEKLINKVNPFIISINFLPEEWKPDLCFISNQKRFIELEPVIGTLEKPPLFLAVSNVTTIGSEYVKIINYSDCIVQKQGISDNAMMMLLRLFMRLKIKKAHVAGFDGYSTNILANYADTNLITGASVEALLELNRSIKNYLNHISKKIKLTFVTPSLYEKKE